MAAEFIGSTVLVTLHAPESALIRGTVCDIVDQKLTLQQVTWLATGFYQPQLNVLASNIRDLEVAPEAQEFDHATQEQDHGHKLSTASELSAQMPPYPSEPSEHGRPSPISSVRHTLHHPTTAFIDPAIVSFGKPPPRPLDSGNPLSPKTQPPPIPKNMLVDAARGSPTRATPTIPTTKPKPVSKKPRASFEDHEGLINLMAGATLSEPFDESLTGSAEDSREPQFAAELGTHGGKGERVQLEGSTISSGKQTGKRTRRNVKARSAKNGLNISLPVEPDSSPVVARKHEIAGRVKGSRQHTPLVEADSLGIHSGFQAPKAKRPPNRRERIKAKDAQNGWATEDATDIQELGDFDFAGNLSKFDKREVFKQLRKDDTTTEESRLVSHNRLPRIGTGGGKNLHWTENVLDSPKVARVDSNKLAPAVNGFAKWTSEAGESEDYLSDSKISSGRSSRRTMSRAGNRRAGPSRKGSGKAGEPSMSSKLLPASFGSIRQPSFSGSPKPKGKRNASTSPYIGPVSNSRPSLRIIGSNRTCPSLSPLQMLEFEQFAVSELGMTEEAMTENAARGIAETVLTALRYLDAETPHSNPLIVVAAGNHKSGSRAIAACRHLRNHGYRVVATTMGLEREEDLLDSVKHQMNAYRKVGGNMLRPSDFLEGLKSNALQPTIFVDALFGIHTVFDDLRRDDQAWYFELVLWASRAEAQVLSIDVPSGVDASNGELTYIDTHPLSFTPSFLLSLGAPKSWLLPTLTEAGVKDSTQLYVADVGISNLAWKRLGNRRNRGVDFGGAWVVGVRFLAGVE